MPNEHTIAENLQRLIDAKDDIAAAITAKGGTVAQGDGLEEFPAAINGISTGVDTSSDTVTPETLAEGVTAHDASGAQITGTMENCIYYVPEGTTEIASTTIPDKAKWFKIVLPASVTIIGDNAFDGCTNLSVLDIKGTITAIGNYAFRSTKLSEFTFPNGISKISDYAFQYCYTLTKIVIPDSVVSIGESAFNQCYSLTTISGGTNIKTIGNYAFTNTHISLKKIFNSMTNVESIGNGAFGGCTLDESFKIPNSLKTIGILAFSNCRLNGSIDMSETSVTTIGNGAFSGTIIDKVILSPFINNIVLNPFYGCRNLREIDAGSNTKYTSIDGSLYEPTTADKVSLISWAMGKDATDITIPESCYNFGSAFMQFTRMTSINIPNRVVSILITAFTGCTNLKTITINKPQDSISGAPWGATNATVVWTG